MTKEDKTKSLVALSVDGGPPRQLISTGWKGMETKFSPDGKLLVAQRQKDGRSEILLAFTPRRLREHGQARIVSHRPGNREARNLLYGRRFCEPRTPRA